MPGARKPNLLFILTDQQRGDALSCAGNGFVRTPNMDRLAREGVRFTNAVTPSAICAPARTSILTGLPIHATGCVTNPDAHGESREGLTTFDDLLVSNGYAAEYVGRWHAPESLHSCYAHTPMVVPLNKRYQAWLAERGYERVEPTPENPYVSKLSGQPYLPDPMDHRYRVAVDGHGHARPEPGLEYGRDTVAPEHSLSACVADQAIEALGRLKDGPFSLTVSILAPHDPFIFPAPFCDNVSESDMELPDTFDDDRRNTQYDTLYWHMDEVERRHAKLIMARYFAGVEEADHHIGRVLDALDALGLAEDTLVIFTSDHGEMLGDHGLMAKFTHYRGAVGIPLLMRMPGKIATGRIAEDPICATDLYATIADYLGVSAPGPRGRSIRHIADGTSRDTDPIAFSQFEHWNVMAQTRKWKYVWEHTAGSAGHALRPGERPGGSDEPARHEPRPVAPHRARQGDEAPSGRVDGRDRPPLARSGSRGRHQVTASAQHRGTQ